MVPTGRIAASSAHVSMVQGVLWMELVSVPEDGQDLLAQSPVSGLCCRYVNEADVVLCVLLANKHILEY